MNSGTYSQMLNERSQSSMSRAAATFHAVAAKWLRRELVCARKPTQQHVSVGVEPCRGYAKHVDGVNKTTTLQHPLRPADRDQVDERVLGSRRKTCTGADLPSRAWAAPVRESAWSSNEGVDRLMSEKDRVAGGLAELLGTGSNVDGVAEDVACHGAVERCRAALGRTPSEDIANLAGDFVNGPLA